MSNITEIQTRKKLATEQLLRIAATVLLLVGAVASIAALAIVPAYLKTHAARSALTLQTEAVKEKTEAAQAESERESLIATRERLTALSAIAGRGNTMTEALRAAMSARPDGLAITALSYAYRDEGSELRISGQMQQRSDLQAYTSALETSALFSAARVPVAALAQAEEGRFVVVAEGTF